MKLQKTVTIQVGYEDESSAHYETPRDKEKLLAIPRRGMYTLSLSCASHVKCPELLVPASLRNFCHISFDSDMGGVKQT
jgi:hypothetical protein